MEGAPIKRAVVVSGKKVRLIGDFDRAALPAIRRWIPGHGGQPTTVDLSECEFLDGSVLALLLENGKATGRSLSIVGATGQPSRLLRTTGLSPS